MLLQIHYPGSNCYIVLLEFCSYYAIVVVTLLGPALLRGGVLCTNI